MYIFSENNQNIFFKFENNKKKIFFSDKDPDLIERRKNAVFSKFRLSDHGL